MSHILFKKINNYPLILKRYVFMVALPILSLTLLLSNSVQANEAVNLEASNLDVRLLEARYVFEDFNNIPAQDIPKDFMQKADVVLIFPNHVKGGYLFAGKFGLGICLVKNKETGQWSPPAFVRLGGGSFGLQIGVQWTDLILIGKGDESIINFLESGYSWGGSASATAGPWGRHLEFNFDWPFRSSLFAYSKSRGFFASLATDGQVLGFDDDHNQMYYGEGITGRDVLFGNVPVNSYAAEELMRVVSAYTQGQFQEQNQMPVPYVAPIQPEPYTPQIQTQALLDSNQEGLTQILDEENKSILVVKNVTKDIKVYFDYNQSKLRDDVVFILEDAAKTLKSNDDLSIVISGYADARGSKSYNYDLALRRAEAIRTFMLDEGIALDRIKVVSRGNEEAKASTSDVSGMQKDRFAQFMLAELQKIELDEASLASLQAEEVADRTYVAHEKVSIESKLRASTKEYTIREGDSLWSISRDHLGSGHRWKYLYDLNRSFISNPNQLTKGQSIVIPVE